MKKLLISSLILLLMMLSGCAASEGHPWDGEYAVGVTLTGGSGRASIDSPAKVSFVNEKATAVIVWSSPYYEYMRMDGQTYYPINTQGNSTFEIPIELDRDLAVIAETVAMSEPHEIEYTLYFDSDTARPFHDHDLIASVIAAGAAGILILGLLVPFLRRRRQKDQNG